MEAGAGDKELTMFRQRHYYDGYARLAAAIIKGGERAHDTAFLESEWCNDVLKGLCELDDALHQGSRRTMSNNLNSCVINSINAKE